MEWSVYLSFCVASFLMALMPGPDNIYVMTESIASGKRNGILIALGLNSGVLFHTLAAATGISLILQQSVLAFKMVQYAGVGYLLYLAYRSYKEEGSPESQTESREKGAWKLYRTGITMNLLNPKVSLFFIAFLPQFVSKEGLNPMVQMIIMGLSFMLIGFITFSAFAVVADQLRKPLQQPVFWKYVKWIKVFILLVLSFFLLLT